MLFLKCYPRCSVVHVKDLFSLRLIIYLICPVKSDLGFRYTQTEPENEKKKQENDHCLGSLSGIQIKLYP